MCVIPANLNFRLSGRLSKKASNSERSSNWSWGDEEAITYFKNSTKQFILLLC